MQTANLSAIGRKDLPIEFFSRSYLATISLNIEGLTLKRDKIIWNIAKEKNVNVLCLLETHQKDLDYNPSKTYMRITGRWPHSKNGSTIFIRNKLVVKLIYITAENIIEIFTIIFFFY